MEFSGKFQYICLPVLRIGIATTVDYDILSVVDCFIHKLEVGFAIGIKYCNINERYALTTTRRMFTIDLINSHSTRVSWSVDGLFERLLSLALVQLRDCKSYEIKKK